MSEHAFPTYNYWDEKRIGQSDGMTLREYFAVRCPESEMPKFTVGEVRKRFNLPEGDLGTNEQWMLIRAEHRYKYADAMMKARQI